MVLAWRWFSGRTIRAASHFRDWSHRRLLAYAGASAAVIALSRLDPGLAISPWLLIAGVLSAAWTARALALKLIDDRRRSD